MTSVYDPHLDTIFYADDLNRLADINNLVSFLLLLDGGLKKVLKYKILNGKANFERQSPWDCTRPRTYEVLTISH